MVWLVLEAAVIAFLDRFGRDMVRTANRFCRLVLSVQEFHVTRYRRAFQYAHLFCFAAGNDDVTDPVARKFHGIGLIHIKKNQKQRLKVRA